LNQKTIDYDKIYNLTQSINDERMSEKQKQKLKEEQRLIQEKMEEAEKSQTYINFINKGSCKLMETTPAEVICELGIKSYVGSHDVPQDIQRANMILGIALEKAQFDEDDFSQDMIEFYLAIIDKKILQQRNKKN
jgi:hypothetical protein